MEGAKLGAIALPGGMHGGTGRPRWQADGPLRCVRDNTQSRTGQQGTCTRAAGWLAGWKAGSCPCRSAVQLSPLSLLGPLGLLSPLGPLELVMKR